MSFDAAQVGSDESCIGDIGQLWVHMWNLTIMFWEGGGSQIFEAATLKAPDAENLREAEVIAELFNVHRVNGVFPTPALELPEGNGAWRVTNDVHETVVP